jgi:microcystin-dependent protein
MSTEAYIGQLALFAGPRAPRGWVACDGSLLKKSEFSALFSLIGTKYGGGGGGVEFAVPDLRGRVPMHRGHGSGLVDRKLGHHVGAERATLSEANLPPHTHEVRTASRATASDPSGEEALVAARVAAGEVTEESSIVEKTGDGAEFDIVPPAQVLLWCMCVDGIYPATSA